MTLALIVTAFAALGACTPEAETGPTAAANSPATDEIEAEPSMPTARRAAAMLSMEHARARADRVTDVSYEIDLILSGELPQYTGEVSIHFDLTGSDSDLTVDFVGGAVHSLIVNGTETDGTYNGFFLTLPAATLIEGANTVTATYSRPYSADGSGLYRFKDPEDGRYYLYTDFEPYDQNRLFPSFDQPDLKARYTTQVTVPADWQVIANVREATISDSGNDKTWSFPPTVPISTYVYALHAGQYRVWESEAGDIPLRLFARESLVPYVYPEHWFGPTREGFAFFNDYFEVAYPFGKYDQIIVPHFNAGAMENVGAVTFSERYLSRGTVTRQNRRRITSVIHHEMAHMWFGDLVTMDWWNGLWLNESFATVMSVLSMVGATEFTDEWQESFLDTIRAYQADERDTTHPIELPTADTDGAFANFDRITYEKGSATLMQLNHLVGPETFRRGVSNYLNEHAYGNTGIDDFLGAISAAADIDLNDWSRDWLLEPGANTVEVDYSCSDGKIESMTILQGAPAEWPTLRTHRTQLGLYYFGDGNVDVGTIPATYSGERANIDDAIGQPCPDMVYANHGDWDYVRVRLARESLPLLREHLASFSDPLTRLMLWQSVWDLALDGGISMATYIDFALSNLEQEPQESALRQVLNALQNSLSYLGEMDTDPTLLANVRQRVETYLWTHVGLSESGSDRQLLFYDNYVRAVTSPAGIERIASLLVDAAQVPAGIMIDQDRRWTLLAVLAANGHPDFADLFATERDKDQTDEGQRRALSVEVSQPDPALKQRWVGALLDPSATANLAEFRAIAGGLFPDGQHELKLASSQTVLDNLPNVSETRDAAFFAPYVGGLLGPICSEPFLDRLEQRIADSDSLHPIISTTTQGQPIRGCSLSADR